MKRIGLFIAFVLLVAVAANADSIQTYSFVGALDPYGNPLTGTITINSTVGTVTAADVLYLGLTYDVILTQGPFDNPNPIDYFVYIGASSAQLPRVDFGIGGPISVDSLVGFAGGPLASNASPAGPDGNGSYWVSGLHDANGGVIPLASGELDPVPEPASLALLGSGLLALGCGIRRKLL